MRGSQPRWVPFQASHPTRVFAFEKNAEGERAVPDSEIGIVNTVMSGFRESGEGRYSLTTSVVVTPYCVHAARPCQSERDWRVSVSEEPRNVLY